MGLESELLEQSLSQPVLPENLETRPAPERPGAGQRFAKNLLAILSLTAAFGAAGAAAQPSSLENGHGPVDCAECALNPNQALTLGRQATATLRVDSAARYSGQDSSGQTAEEPHLGLGVEDDVAVASVNPNLINTSTNRALSMGANWWRDILYPKDALRQKWAEYDLSVNSAVSKGLNVTMTLACNDERWTDKKFQRYVTSAVKRYDKEGVHSYSICNEPNFPGWLDTMPGKTLPQTYRDLYVNGYLAVKQQAQKDGVNDEISIFEVSSEVWPLRFMKQVLACPPPNPSACAPLLADQVGYHPYTQTTPPTEHSQKPGEVGMGSLGLVLALMKSEYDAGKLRTPDGQEPTLGLDEFAYQLILPSAAHHHHSPSHYSDEIRRQYYRQVLEIACRYLLVSRFIFYGESSSTSPSKLKWNSPLVSPKGTPYGSLYTIQSFKADHPQCFTG